ncbi:MAG: hypothetical protein QHH18_03215 [Candidatus Bathyarchaeota archaeon]|nr:hypothetical protein [Candidatus Bathyarchaeota archaeon A05DMB-5]MDH7557602.1 hypothetical protein [Candidatus Bathyarchaeota archaeon]
MKLKAEQRTEHEWVSEGYVIGFMTNRGLILDLDNMKFKKARWLARKLCKQYRLEGYLLIKSSHKNYHVVFNRYLTWKTITKILFNQYEALRWAVFQMQSGYLTLRISRKNGKNKPRILLKVGKTDKLINDYLEVYNAFKGF